MKKIIITMFALVLMTINLAGCGLQNAAVAAPIANRTATIEDNQLQWAYTREGEHPEKMLVDVINSAKSTLNISIYSITLDEIVNAILAAHKRGVKVRIMSDGDQSASKYQKEDLQKLRSTGIPIKVDTHPGYLHLKMTCADGQIVTTGSFNYSKQAATDNDEILVVIKNEKMAQAYEKVFEDNWNDKKNFQDFK
ncbi:phospholipase D-like domain-containing protein [Paenibacillus aestuarii]|uniref:phospholipase D n=1 Tax=Paenibacillus aestuarii TaxID=516965 RepID=A0ABW0K8H5_9BACL